MKAGGWGEGGSRESAAHRARCVVRHFIQAMASDRNEGKAPVDPLDDGEGPYERMQSGMRMQ